MLPLYVCRISAGFPSPADDYIDKKIDLNEHLIKNPSSTFFIRVKGDSMIKAGISDGDLIVIDRAKDAVHEDIVLAVVQGEFTLKRILLEDGRVTLKPENDGYKNIEINESMGFEIWGVATNVIHSLK